MGRLSVFIEVNGENKYVGTLTGTNSDDTCFSYADTYLNDPAARAISISLPLEERTFSASRTRIFFEGLLPEGFTRRCVAQWMQLAETDYVSLLAGLGKECLGAIQITENDETAAPAEYRELTESEVYALASEGATESAELVTKSHLSLTGASGKVGLYYDEPRQKWFLPIGKAPSTHIVKQSHVRLKKIVANEQLCLLTAKQLGISIPESFIVSTDGNDETMLFATRRYDRKIAKNTAFLNGLSVPHRLHQEDFGQALGIAATDKYERNHENYLEKLFQVIRSYCTEPMADSLKLWDICVFNYLVGNTDNHIKNLSLLYSEDLSGLRLAPAYDIVSTLVYESSTENMALGIDGIRNIRGINRASFAKAASRAGLGERIALQRFDTMAEGFSAALHHAAKELTEQGFEPAEELCQTILQKGGIGQL